MYKWINHDQSAQQQGAIYKLDWEGIQYNMIDDWYLRQDWYSYSILIFIFIVIFNIDIDIHIHIQYNIHDWYIYIYTSTSKRWKNECCKLNLKTIHKIVKYKIKIS